MKWIAAILAAIVLAMPLGFASQETAEAKTVSATDLRFKQIGQAFGDFVFHIKAFLTFDEEARVELLKERNAEMQERQQAWLEAKVKADLSSDMTVEEKKEIRNVIQAEHETIIKEHLRLTEELHELQLKAKAGGNTQLDSEARAAVELKAELNKGLSLGLGSSGNTDVETKIDTAAEAQAVVEKKLGFETSTVTTETRNGVEVFVVTGNETRTKGNFELTKSFKVVIAADSGLILSADMTTHFEQTTTATASASAGSSVSSNISAIG